MSDWRSFDLQSLTLLSRMLPIKGGVTGFWVETTGAVGDIALSVSTTRLGTQRLSLRAE